MIKLQLNYHVFPPLDLQTLTAANKSLEKKLMETEKALFMADAHRIPSKVCSTYEYKYNYRG